jgi:acetyl-CoA C-acetyltransferase
MGSFAEECADAFGFTREQQDAYAIESLRRAQAAIASGAFADEIVALDVTDGKQQRQVRDDEQPPKASLDKIPQLRPAFREGGTVTAANSSSISDGAAALVMMRRSEAERWGLQAQAVIHGHAAYADAPSRFTTAPIGAIGKLMERTGWRLADVDLIEINEAFAVVPMAAMRELDIDHARLNVNGGACALGHPVGASGARILATLIHALRARQLRRGVAAICIGGGEATAMAIELI